MPDVNGRGRGDLFATVQVQTPKKLTQEQRQLIEQLAKALPKEKFEPRPRRGRAGRAQSVRSRQGHVRIDGRCEDLDSDELRSTCALGVDVDLPRDPARASSTISAHGGRRSATATMRLFFHPPTRATPRAPNCARTASTSAPLDVSDEDWARRSQENLEPVTVGRITVVADPESDAAAPQRLTRHPSPDRDRDPPVDGLRHRSSRDDAAVPRGAAARSTSPAAIVLDVGTGSGVLAIAADRLGAARTLGIDSDPDAIQSAARESRAQPDGRARRRSRSSRSRRRAAAAGRRRHREPDRRAARRGPPRPCSAAVRAGGTLILSGILATSATTVRGAFAARPRLLGARGGRLGRLGS